MHISTAVVAAAATLPLASAQLNLWAKRAGLKYFGAATDSPGQRERAGLEASYPQYDAIMRDTREFGQTTPTNGMKWLFTEPQPGVFNWTEGEITSSLAKRNGQFLRCHALVWHSQLAPWVESSTWSRDNLTEAIVRHVKNVAGHWKGQCYAWDVVNEAINDDGSWRQSIFYQVLGVDFIKIAFRAAAEADPGAKLYYNDYNLERVSNKTRKVLDLIDMLREDGIRIDGVGLQAHLRAESHPTLDQHIEVMKSYVAKGNIEIALTELDVRLNLPANATNLAQQNDAYTAIVGACAQVKGCIGVTLWDFYDAFSWVPYVFAGQGAPLLWFDNFTKHPAYYGVIEALKNNTKCNKGKRSTKLF